LGALTLSGGAVTLSGNSGNISMASTVNGAQSLTVNTSGTTTFGGATSIASLVTDAGGSTAFNGSTISTTGAQTYNDTVNLISATTLSSTAGGNITFASNLAGSPALTVTTTSGGSLSFGGSIGTSGTPLSSLTSSGSSLSFASTVDVGTLSLNSSGGTADILDNGSWTITGSTVLTSGRDIILDNLSSTFGTLTLTAVNATVKENSSMVIGNSTITGTLSLSNLDSSGITDTGIINANTLDLFSVGGSIVLNSANTITQLGAVNTQNGSLALTDGGGLTLGGNIDTGTGNLTLNISSGSVTQPSGTITTLGTLSLSVPSGSISLNANANNSIGTLGNVTRGGDFILVDHSGGLTVNGTISGTLASEVLIVTLGGDLTLASGTSISSTGSGNDIKLATDQYFINQAGSTVFTVDGGSGSRFIVFSDGPESNQLGNIPFDFEEFSIPLPQSSYTSASFPVPAHTTGNVLLYSNALPPPPPPPEVSTETLSNFIANQAPSPTLVFASLTDNSGPAVTYSDAGGSSVPGTTSGSSGETTTVAANTTGDKPAGDTATGSTEPAADSTAKSEEPAAAETTETKNDDTKKEEEAKGEEKKDEDKAAGDQTQIQTASGGAAKDDKVVPAGTATVMGGSGNLPIGQTPMVLQKAVSIEVKGELQSVLQGSGF